jgi:hypothetical protein
MFTSTFEFVHTASALTRLNSAIARLENEPERKSMWLFPVIFRAFALITMSSGAGLFVLGGL